VFNTFGVVHADFRCFYSFFSFLHRKSVFISRFFTASSLVPECTIFEQFSFSFARFAISLAYRREDFVFKMRGFFFNEPNIFQWMFVAFVNQREVKWRWRRHWELKSQSITRRAVFQFEHVVFWRAEKSLPLRFNIRE
jgi:hypothetical protein